MKKMFMFLIIIFELLITSCTKIYTYTVNYIYDDKIIETITYKNNYSFQEIDYFLENKVFKGYYYDKELENKIDINNYKINQNCNIYLKYEDYKIYNILYIPLDNRPINKDRVILLSKSLNINLIMPEEDLYRTYLDNQLLNSNNTQIGNKEGLMDFIKSIDIDNIDSFIISLDQLTSGGLVNSRSNIDLNIDDEILMLKEIKNIVSNKPLYIIDTVMRLATTAYFNNQTIDDYFNQRNYANEERLKLSIDQLTLDNIINNYNKDKDGFDIDFNKYGLSKEQVNNYLSSRKRKLLLSNNAISIFNSPNTHYFLGIDDSSNTYNIQKNEINYFKKIKKDIMLFPGTDELGLMSIAKCYQDLINIKNNRVKLTIFGDNYLSIDNTYDGISIKENIELHLKALNIEIDEDNYDFEILLLTNDNSDTKLSKESMRLVNKMKNNFLNNILTCIIDTNAINSSNQKILPQYLLNNDLSLLLGFSSWNTIGNSIGIALAQANSRISYLKSDYSLYKTKCDEGFINSLIFGFIKDIGYKTYVESEMKTFIDNNAKDQNGKNIQASYNFYQYLPYSLDFSEKLNELMNEQEKLILPNFINKRYYSSLRKDISFKTINDVNISNYHFPWYRSFEISFEIDSISK